MANNVAFFSLHIVWIRKQYVKESWTGRIKYFEILFFQDIRKRTHNFCKSFFFEIMIFQFIYLFTFLQNHFWQLENESIPKAKSPILDKHFGKKKNLSFS